MFGLWLVYCWVFFGYFLFIFYIFYLYFIVLFIIFVRVTIDSTIGLYN
jgi:hypothetical protein